MNQSVEELRLNSAELIPMLIVIKKYGGRQPKVDPMQVMILIFVLYYLVGQIAFELN